MKRITDSFYLLSTEDIDAWYIGNPLYKPYLKGERKYWDHTSYLCVVGFDGPISQVALTDIIVLFKSGNRLPIVLDWQSTRSEGERKQILPTLLERL